uniref:FecR family protein n=1 Tax=uncultured Draconibacterium sp. TaxID=1573823 RepID=UPI0032162E6B
MDQFLRYFENKKFVRWVIDPTDELDTYWNNYIIQNPSDKEEIELARLLVTKLKSKKEPELENEALEIFTEIIKKLDSQTHKSSFRKFVITSGRYAAVALLFFLLGIFVYYIQKPSGLEQIAENYIISNNADSSQLILTDGKILSVPEKESIIKYQHSKQIVINQRDTIAIDSEPKVTNLNQLIVPFGKTSKITLSDGTIACLYAGSRLFYPPEFDNSKREVHLIGQAFFDVTHNPDQPFHVKTNGMDIEVLGTKFNVSAFPAEKVIETVLVEGSVKLKKNGFHLLADEIILEPNQRAEYDLENTETIISKVNVENYISWQQGYLSFEKEELNRVIKRLERFYNIKFKWTDPTLGIKSISGKLILDEDINSVLQVLANSASVEIRKINETTYILK